MSERLEVGSSRLCQERISDMSFLQEIIVVLNLGIRVHHSDPDQTFPPRSLPMSEPAECPMTIRSEQQQTFLSSLSVTPSRQLIIIHLTKAVHKDN